MNRSELRLAKDVAFDIRELAEWNADTSEGTLRHGSVVLRRLLIHGDFRKAWRLTGFAKQPKIQQFHNLDSSLGALPDGTDVIFSQAGGGQTPIGQISSIIMKLPPNTDTDAHMRFLHEQMRRASSQEVFLSDYMKGTCLCIGNITVSREELIKFVANKLGGAHSDEKLETPAQNSMWNTLENYYVGNHSHVYHQILAIGQELFQSSDTTYFLDHLKHLGI